MACAECTQMCTAGEGGGGLISLTGLAAMCRRHQLNFMTDGGPVEDRNALLVLLITGEHPRLHPPDATFSYGQARPSIRIIIIRRRFVTVAAKLMSYIGLTLPRKPKRRGRITQLQESSVYSTLSKKPAGTCMFPLLCTGCSIFVVFQN